MTFIPSAGLIDTLRFGSNLVLARLTVYSTGNPTTYIVPVSVATVTITRNSAQRRQCTITAQLTPTIPPPPLMPTNPSSILSPFGNEIFVEIGIAKAGSIPANATITGITGGVLVNTVTYVPLGLFTMSTVTVEDTTIDLAVTVEGYDRSFVIAQRKFKKPYNVPAVTGNFVAEIQHLLNDVWGTTKPALRYNITPTTATVTKQSFNQGSTPWTAALQMANAVGYELFFNATGVVTAYPIPTPATQPVAWNFTDTQTAVYGATGTGGSTTLEGSPYSTPAACKMQMTRDGIFNDVIVTGTGSYNATGARTPTTPATPTRNTAPVLGEAKTTNPLSASRVTGPVGDIPEFISTNMVYTDTQATAAANNYLKAALSDAWQISITSPPIPFLDVDSVVTITRPRMGLTNVRVILDSITAKTSYGDLFVYSGRVVSG